jgi:hypothetical protein
VALRSPAKKCHAPKPNLQPEAGSYMNAGKHCIAVPLLLTCSILADARKTQRRQPQQRAAYLLFGLTTFPITVHSKELKRHLTSSLRRNSKSRKEFDTHAPLRIIAKRESWSHIDRALNKFAERNIISTIDRIRTSTIL